MAKYEKYAEYKDSGVEWLGKIPSHWEVSKFAYVINTVGDIDHYMPDSVDIGIPYIMTGDLQENVSEIELTNCKQVSQEAFQRLSKKIKTSKDDVILARYATIGTASYVDVDADFLVSYSCVTIKPKRSKTTGKYLFCYLKSDAFLQAIQMQVNSNTQGNVGVDSLRAVKVLMPPLEEQNFIINFLDHETAKIDSLIAKQENLIELLKEKRQAVISHAVTKGLNPDVNMKDSGVEWLGQVPEHWTVSCIKYILAKEKDAMVDGPFGSSVNTSTDYVGEGIPVIRTVNITNQGFSSDNLKFMRISKFEELKRHSVKSGDVLFSKVGTIGNACIFPENMGVGILSTTGSCKISINEDLIDRDFLVFQIHSMNQELMQIANANVQPFLNMTNIKNLRISLPSLDEQQSIISLLKSKLDSFDRLITKAESAIQLMQERRTALISSVVTGKIDVRHHASRPSGNDKMQTEDI